MDKVMNVLTKVVNWLEADNKVPFLVDDLSNAGVIFLGAVVVGMIAVCCSKKLRDMLF